MNGSPAPALSHAEVAATAAWIAEVQLPTGMIPWYPGGHADPWNHTEAAMALVLVGRRAEAEAAYEWLRSTQEPDGSWCLYHLAEGIEEPRRDPNVGAYVATGVWWHWRHTGDRGFVETMWPTVTAAIDFALGLQVAGGEVLWSVDVDGHVGHFALLTATSSILRSLRCALALAAELGQERPAWERGAERMAGAIRRAAARADADRAEPDPAAEAAAGAADDAGGSRDGGGGSVGRGAFWPKDRWAMDWYYPVLSGALSRTASRARLARGRDPFVMPGLGVRCVSDHDWVTAAETAECVMALDAVGARDEAEELLAWTRQLRDEDGAYGTGCVHPQRVRFPSGERSTYSAAAVLLADHLLHGSSGARDLFRLAPDGAVADAPVRGATAGQDAGGEDTVRENAVREGPDGQDAVTRYPAVTAARTAAAAWRPERMQAGIPDPR